MVKLYLSLSSGSLLISKLLKNHQTNSRNKIGLDSFKLFTLTSDLEDSCHRPNHPWDQRLLDHHQYLQ